MKKSIKKQVTAVQQLELTFKEESKCILPSRVETKIIDFHHFENYQRKSITAQIIRSTKSF